MKNAGHFKFVCALIINIQLIATAYRRSFSSEYWSNELQFESRDNIIGGQPSTNVVPYMVSLQYKSDVSEHFCGGAIISTYHVVTAAHCFRSFDDDDEIVVVVGTVDVRHGEEYDIKHIFIHPQFESMLNDIAVVEVTSKFDFTKPNVQPIKMGVDYLPANVSVMTPGWGLTQLEPPDLPNILQLTYQKTMDNVECAEKWLRPIIESQLCSFNTSRTCKGDSGGPVVTVDTREPELVGVVSYGPRNCGEQRPNVRTRLSSFTKFIRDAMEDDVDEY